MGEQNFAALPPELRPRIERASWKFTAISEVAPDLIGKSEAELEQILTEALADAVDVLDG